MRIVDYKTLATVIFSNVYMTKYGIIYYTHVSLTLLNSCMYDQMRTSIETLVSTGLTQARPNEVQCLNTIGIHLCKRIPYHLACMQKSKSYQKLALIVFVYTPIAEIM